MVRQQFLFMVTSATRELFNDFAEYSGLEPSGLAYMLAEEQAPLVAGLSLNALIALNDTTIQALGDNELGIKDSCIHGSLEPQTFEVYCASAKRCNKKYTSIAKVAILYGFVEEARAERFALH